MRAKRRYLLVIRATIRAIDGLRAMLWERFSDQSTTYSAIVVLPPLRTLKTGGKVSEASVALIGLHVPDEDAPARRARMGAVKANLCGALFGKNPSSGIVSIAYCSAFICPYCRALERASDETPAEESGTVQLAQHELPFFAPLRSLQRARNWLRRDKVYSNPTGSESYALYLSPTGARSSSMLPTSGSTSPDLHWT